MFKLLLLIALIVVVILLFKSYKRRAGSGADTPAGPDAGTGGRAERMVRCAHCGLYLPEAESLEARGRTFCSEEHKRLAETPSGR